MTHLDPALFYTGLVASLYTPLRGSSPDPEIYARFIEKHGQPALELGCGTGDPIIELVRRGLDVDGIDISTDMLAVCRTRAAAAGVELHLREARIESVDMGRTYKSVFLAGPTFNLLPDDATALAALKRIAAHLDADGMALVPLHIPDPMPEASLNIWKHDTDAGGRSIRFAVIAAARDEGRRIQTSTLRYERGDGDSVEALERDFTLHWWTQDEFRALVAEAGLVETRMLGNQDSSAFAFWLARSRHS